MKKEIALELKNKAKEIAKYYSLEEREHNANKELFEVFEIIPLSEYGAAVVYLKQPTGKKAVAYFYWIEMSGGQWRYFFPKDSHILDFMQFGKIKQKIEVENFDKNN